MTETKTNAQTVKVAVDPEPKAADADDPSAKTIEAWRDERKTDPAFFAATRAHYGWPDGLRLTGETYDAAIAYVCKTPLFGSSAPAKEAEAEVAADATTTKKE